MSIIVDSGMTGLAPSGRKSSMSVSHGSSSVLVMVMPQVSVFIFLSQRLRGVLGSAGRDFLEVFDVYPGFFRVAAALVF